eukprot:NODE_1013_length_2220_cov_0.669967.p3 type:complete len:153 gc:universal NODE_1013_length_2220_cov_0.669967:538-80(-)
MSMVKSLNPLLDLLPMYKDMAPKAPSYCDLTPSCNSPSSNNNPSPFIRTLLKSNGSICLLRNTVGTLNSSSNKLTSLFMVSSNFKRSVPYLVTGTGVLLDAMIVGALLTLEVGALLTLEVGAFFSTLSKLSDASVNSGISSQTSCNISRFSG